MANNIQLNAILKLIDAEVDARVLQRISRATAGLPNALGGVAANAKNASTQLGGLSQQVSKLGGGLSGSERAGRLLLQRMTQFAILLPTFVTINRAIQNSIGFLVEFDTQIRKIISLNPDKLADDFEKISDAAFSVAENTRTSALDAAKGLRLFAQAGFDIQKSLELANVSSLAAKVSTLEVADAQELAIATTKVFGDQIGSIGDAFDKIVAVEDLAAVGAQDIAEAFRTGGNALAFATKSFEDTIGLIGALREQTRKSGREVGTFFKTLSTRITAAGESQSALENLGVRVTDLGGNIRPLLDVLQDLKVVFDDLTEAQQANAAKAIAGVRQFESFIGVINSLDRATQLSAKAQTAQGTIQEKNAVIAQSLSEQFAALVVQGQKVAKALGDAGIGDALQAALDISKVFLGVLEKTAQVFKQIGSSVTPLLTLFGGIGVSSVLGFGGGARSLLGLKGNAGGAGAPATGGANLGGPFGANAAALDQLTKSTVSANTAIGQLVRNVQHESEIDLLAIRLKNLNSASLAANLQAYRNQNSVIAQATQTVKSGFNRVMGDSTKRIVALTAASLAAGPAIKALSSVLNSIIPGIDTFGQEFQHTATAGLQTGLQFGIISKKAGLVAGSFASIITAGEDLADFFRERAKDRERIKSGNRKQAEITNAQARFSDQGANGLGDILLSQISKQIQGSINKEVDLDRVLSNAIKNSERLKQAFAETGTAGLKQALLSQRGVAGLAFADPTNFIDQDALKQLQDSFDATGRSSLKTSEQLYLLFKALGQVDEKVQETSGLVSSAAFDFGFLKDISELISDALDLQDANKSLKEFQLSIDDLPQGLDALKVAVENTNGTIEIAQAQFEKLKEGLLANSPSFNLSNNQGELLFKSIFDLIRAEGPNAKAFFADFINGLTDDEKEFAKEAFKINNDLIAVESERYKTIQELNKEIAAQTQKVADDERESRIAAANALDDFKISLLEFGDITDTSAINIDEIAKSFSKLTDVEKAQLELGNVSKKTSIEIDKVNQEIAGIDEQISKLKQSGLEDAFKEAGLQNEKAGKQLEIENLKRQQTIDTIKAQVSLLDAEQKAAETAKKKEEERLKAVAKLEEEANDFNRALKDAARSFEDFQLDRLGELADNQADAFADLQDAQQDVLNATQDLEDAYKDFVQAIYEINGALAEARINANLLERDIGELTGSLVTFDDKLFSLDSAFSNVLDNANITLAKRIELERQLANETLDFLKEAQSEITGAGLNVFGQSFGENQDLGKGIAALSFVVQQLGGSFENFLGLGQQDLATVGQELLNLPLSVRQSILDALSALPSTLNIGGFNVEQLTQALGQVGAGVAPEIGLPSLEELTGKQVEQLQILQDLALRDAQLQFSQLATAQAQLDKAEEALAIAQIEETRASEALIEISEQTSEEIAVLEAANIERQELTERIIAANDTLTLRQIEEEARLFSEQNSVFRDIGKEIVQGITTSINARINQIEAAATLANLGSAYKGHIPNFARGNLSPGEAAGLLRAASREKRHMPAGAGLAVANTSEAIIPMRYKGSIPNFQGGNIAAGIQAANEINQAAVAAIASSINQALQGIQNETADQTVTLLEQISSLLTEVRDELGTLSESSAVIESNTSSTGTDTTTTTGATTNVNIQVDSNQNQQIRVTGIDTLADQLTVVLQEAAVNQANQQIEPLVAQIKEIIRVLRERNIISAIGTSL